MIGSWDDCLRNFLNQPTYFMSQPNWFLRKYFSGATVFQNIYNIKQRKARNGGTESKDFTADMNYQKENSVQDTYKL